MDFKSEVNKCYNLLLIVSASCDYLVGVEDPILYKADVNYETLKGWTPLMYAAYYGHLKAVQILIEAGAKVYTKTSFGYTAFDVVKSDVIKNALKYRKVISTEDPRWYRLIPNS